MRDMEDDSRQKRAALFKEPCQGHPQDENRPEGKGIGVDKREKGRGNPHGRQNPKVPLEDLIAESAEKNFFKNRAVRRGQKNGKGNKKG